MSGRGFNHKPTEIDDWPEDKNKRRKVTYFCVGVRNYRLET